MLYKKMLKYRNMRVMLALDDSLDECTVTLGTHVETLPAYCCGATLSDDNTPLAYAIVLKTAVADDSTIVHEVYHLFHMYLHDIDNGSFTAEELSRDMYCYMFTDLYTEVSKEFRKLRSKLEKEKENESLV